MPINGGSKSEVGESRFELPPAILIRRAGSTALESISMSFSVAKGGSIIVKAANLQSLAASLEEGDEVLFQHEVVSKEGQPEESPIRFLAEGLSLDTGMKRLLVDEQELGLGTKEYGILVYLSENKNRIMHPSQIYSNVWDTTYSLQSHTLRVNVGTLRKKLGRFSWMIQTRKGYGYMYVDDPELAT